MVYCGKASLGCQSCRTRRIKCDKARPECSQCIRVKKKCPGYRDQLSLMFRDESTKVIQKAHAQWGWEESPGGSASSRTASLTPQSWIDTSPATFAVERRDSAVSVSVSVSTSAGRRASVAARTAVARMPREMATTDVDHGIQFFIQHYLVGHPDEAQDMQDLREVKWLHKPNVSEMMAAVGLASLGNLTGDGEMHRRARQRYGMALQHTAKAIQNLERELVDDPQALTRSVVMLAMYEVVRGNQEPTTSARTHIMGATALIKSLAPYLDATDCSRGLMQLCFSMFVPTHVSAIALPDTYFDMITAAEELTQPADRPAAQLLVAATRFVQLAAFVRGHVLSDGKPRTANTLRELLLIDAELVAWEAERERVSSTSASSPISFTTTTTTTTMAGHPEDAGATGQDYARPQDIWTFAVECDDPADPFPAAAVFRGRFHAYSSMWTARVWNHYRWVRLSTAQMLLEAADRFPQSAAAAGIGAPAVRAALTAAVQRMAAATLASLPTHWRHPALRPAQRARINRKSSGAGIGAAGVPTLLFQIKSAACAPGTPHAHWAWALDVLDTIWRDTGMLQARALAGVVRAHGEAVYPIYHPDAYLPPAHGTTRAGHVLGVGGVDASAMKFELM